MPTLSLLGVTIILHMRSHCIGSVILSKTFVYVSSKKRNQIIYVVNKGFDCNPLPKKCNQQTDVTEAKNVVYHCSA
jgi:hypothetical protein